MSENSDPRWGQEGRETKAIALLRTLEALVKGEANLREGTWLDIGCGSGGVAASLAEHVTRVIGIDPESWERWAEFQRDRPNLTLRKGSYRDLLESVPAGSIDVVVCNQVYEHVDDPIALLQAIAFVLKPGGWCYFAGPNLLWPIEPHVFWPFVHWLPRDFAQRCMRLLGSKRANDLDAWSWAYWRLVRAFRRAGFTVTIAIRERLAAESTVRSSLPLRAACTVPGPIVSMLAPLAPGFVFMLRKNGRHGTNSFTAVASKSI